MNAVAKIVPATPEGAADAAPGYELRTSVALDQLATALAAAQGEFERIAKGPPVHVRTDKASYSFRYADLDAVLDATRPALLRHGIVVVQMPVQGGGRAMLATRLLHTSGQWIESAVEIRADRPGAQGWGSAITYARRYALCAALNVTADQDDDGNAADGNEVRPAAARGGKPRADAGAGGRRELDRTRDADADVDAPAWLVVSRDGREKVAAGGAAWVAEWRQRLAAVRKAQKRLPADKRETVAAMLRCNLAVFEGLTARGEGPAVREVRRLVAELQAELVDADKAAGRAVAGMREGRAVPDDVPDASALG